MHYDLGPPDNTVFTSDLALRSRSLPISPPPPPPPPQQQLLPFSTRAPTPFTVLDPESRSITISTLDTVVTKALDLFQQQSSTNGDAPEQGGNATVPTLCRLFQRGRCRQGVNCHQVHADPDVVRRHRDAVRANPPCCCIHNSGSEVNIRGLPPSLSIIVDGATTVTLLSMEPTRGLRDLYLTHGSLQLECTFAQLCRNHSGTSICRFGPLCGYLHVCSTIYLNICKYNVDVILKRLDSKSLVAAHPQVPQPSSTRHTDALVDGTVSVVVSTECEAITERQADDRGGSPSLLSPVRQSLSAAAEECRLPSGDTTTSDKQIDEDDIVAPADPHRQHLPSQIVSVHDPYRLQQRRRSSTE